jgi:hypothetical protein
MARYASNRKKMKILLVQFYNYHEEVLAPQIEFLLPDNDVFIAAPKSAFKNHYIKTFDLRIKKIIFDDANYDIHEKRWIIHRAVSMLIKYIQLFRNVRKRHIDFIVFNTITKPFHFIFIKLLFGNIEMAHIIHNAQNYTTKKAMARLNIFKKNLFISHDVYDFYTTNICTNENKSRFGWFLPTLINFIPHNDVEAFSEIVIVIPGGVDNNRRNYKGFLAALEALPPPPPIPSVLFILLGRCPIEVQRQIMNMGLGGLIKTYAEYVPPQEMLHYIKNADAIAFLIDKDIGENYYLYNRYKATGTSVFCLSFGVPCIASSDFLLDSGLSEKAVIYPGTHIEDVLSGIINGKLPKDYFRKLKDIPVSEMYSYQYQRRHYREALLGEEA